MDWNEYHFASEWTLAADPDIAYAVLHEVADYPRWWPQVREAVRQDDDRIRLRTRALLPYDIAFTLTRQVADPAGRILQARLEGDIDGTIRWSIVRASGGSMITWDQRVVMRKALLRRIAPIARPAFIANHALMMRDGRRGLRVYVAGYVTARSRDTTSL